MSGVEDRTAAAASIEGRVSGEREGKSSTRENPNDETRNPHQIRITNDGYRLFRIRISSLIRISGFVIRISFKFPPEAPSAIARSPAEAPPAHGRSPRPSYTSTS